MIPYHDPPILFLNFDGACWPNPGGLPTFGWHIDNDAGEHVAHGKGTCPRTNPAHRTNNTAEWAGLRAGLLWLQGYSKPIDALHIRGDSQLVIYQLTGRMRTSKPHLVELRDECRKILDTIEAAHIEVTWIPREENAEADRLSKSRA